jgi:hypothetical protein
VENNSFNKLNEKSSLLFQKKFIQFSAIFCDVSISQSVLDELRKIYFFVSAAKNSRAKIMVISGTNDGWNEATHGRNSDSALSNRFYWQIEVCREEDIVISEVDLCVKKYCFGGFAVKRV